MRPRENVSKAATGASSGVNPECWVDDHGDCLYRYALLRVRRPEVAEDLVQETFYVAVRTYSNFQGKSSERSLAVRNFEKQDLRLFPKTWPGDVFYRLGVPQR